MLHGHHSRDATRLVGLVTRLLLAPSAQIVDRTIFHVLLRDHIHFSPVTDTGRLLLLIIIIIITVHVVVVVVVLIIV